MATISNPNDPNRDPNKPVSVTTANAAPISGPSSSSGSPAQSGQYSTLQKYLSSNSQAGERLGQQVGQNVQQQSQAAENASTSALTNANAATGQSGDFSKKLSQADKFKTQLQAPVIQQQTQPVNSYDVNKYSTNVAGLNNLKNIANNADTLNQFKGLSSNQQNGLASGFEQARLAADTSVKNALNAAESEKQKNQELQKNLKSEQGRSSILNQMFNANPNYRSGLKQLDQAFLQQDKSGNINKVAEQIAANQNNINTRNQQASDYQKTLANLVGQASTKQNELYNAANDINTAYRSDLQKRINTVNQAKDARIAQLNDAVNQFKNKNEITQNNAELFGLTPEVLKSLVDNQKLNSYVNSQVGNTSGVRLFNVGDQLKDYTSLFNNQILGTKALSQADVANANDIENLNAIAALTGNTNDITQTSQFTGDQLGQSQLPKMLQDRLQAFKDQDLKQQFNYETGDRFASVPSIPTIPNSITQSPSGNWVLPPSTINNFRASTGASTDLANYLTGNGIYRETQSGGNWTQRGYAGADQLANPYNNPNLNGNILQTTEKEAVDAVKNQAEQYLNNIGYQNLLRILQG